MTEFSVHRGTAVPLRRSEIDTDQIIPGRFCKRVTRTGYADALFANWRDEPGYILDRPEYQGATILVTGPHFGIGSSREHAVWALQDHGFRAVVAPSFSDIFRGNALTCGLLPVQVPQRTVEALWEAVEADPALPVTVDLERCVVHGGGVEASFPVEETVRQRLLQGLDFIAATLEFDPDITAYESGRARWMPTTTVPLR
ncbi:3-isopropylmalate dehydratase small subunit [Streptomyces violens]|uniref:3-isopropylmalate dehydratase small subunit n=1 Tax=Streptomyces violens TaxID=66377 RepID=UPI0004BF7D5F|nr:3-isopropylmalate dehydratase small subunit [Streptomyces violens]